MAQSQWRASLAIERAHDTHGECHHQSRIAAWRGAFIDMRADSKSRPTEVPTVVGVRSGTALDPRLVAELRAVAGRTDIAHRVLASSIRPSYREHQPQPAEAAADAPDSREKARWYRSGRATQRGGENLQIELADNTTSKFLRQLQQSELDDRLALLEQLRDRRVDP